ncbi:MAG TPA: AI-2E family transporter [Candidatus Limnocylindria bacterium]|nr:AI-2E family transporter [Candidatus Limnocylindria bacterium]
MAATTPTAPVDPFRDRPFWNRTWLVVGVLLLVLFLAFVVRQGASTFYFILMAWFVALAMEPAVSKLAQRMRRGLATGLVMLLGALGLAGFLWLFGSLFVDQVSSFIEAVPDMAADALAWFNRVTGADFTFDTILDRLGVTTTDLAGYADDVAFGVLNVLASILSGFFGLFVLVFFVFYVSSGMPSLRRWIARRVRPDLQVPFLAAWDLTEIKVGGYIAARVVLATVNSVLSGIVFAVIGLPYWLPLALWTGLVAQFVPNVGTYIAIALPVLVGLTSPEPILGVYVLIWGIAYQQVENLTIEPRISARAVALHPAVSFGAALLGAQLFGISGALLGVPVAATAMALLEIYKQRYELTPETEERVAALVAPSADRSWRDDESDEDDQRASALVTSSPPVDAPGEPDTPDHPHGKEPA